MPEKISIKQMRQWLELYEGGKTVGVLAHKFRRDVRTINSGIERARRERSVETIRTGIMMDAIKQHQETLLNAVNGIISDLQISIETFIALTGDSDSSFLAIMRAEETPSRELLKRHLPRDPLWDLVTRWRKSVIDFADGCINLRRSDDQLLAEKCHCPIVEDVVKPPFLFTRAPEMIYAEVLHVTTDSQPRTDINKSLKVDRKSGLVVSGGTTLAVAPGREEEFAKHIREVLNDLTESEEAAALSNRYTSMLSAKEKARKAAEDIVLLGMVPGLCRICQRLGL